MKIMLDIPDVTWRAFMDAVEPTEASARVTAVIDAHLRRRLTEHA